MPSRQTNLTARIRAYQDIGRIGFLHLADGAMSDNLGIRPAIDVVLGAGDFQEVQHQLGLAGIRRVAVITVNAAGEVGSAVAARRAAPGMVAMATLAGAALVEEATEENRVLLREVLERIATESSDDGERHVDTYWIDVELADLQDTTRKNRLREIPTSLYVPKSQVDELICSARELLLQSTEYQRLLRDLSGAAPGSAPCVTVDHPQR